MKEVMSPFYPIRKGILEFTPDLDVLDEYQLAVRSQVTYESTDGTIRGKDPFTYMHDGLEEEASEPWDADRFNPGYNRMGSLLRELGEHGQGDFFPGDTSGTAIELHQKEFGDISWYLANRLALDGIVMSAAVDRGRKYYIEHGKEFSPGFHAVFEDTFPGLMLQAYGSAAIFASEAMIAERTDENREKLAEAAGVLIMMMSQVVEMRLDTTYVDILQQNIAKIKKRMADGTVFDKSGGDAR